MFRTGGTDGRTDWGGGWLRAGIGPTEERAGIGCGTGGWDGDADGWWRAPAGIALTLVGSLFARARIGLDGRALPAPPDPGGLDTCGLADWCELEGGPAGGEAGVCAGLGTNAVGVEMFPNCELRGGSGPAGGSRSSGTMRRSVVRSSDGSPAGAFA